MELRGIDFGNILGASGVQGFFGEGYWFHGIFHPFGLDFTGMTFVSKTATLYDCKGNMPLTADYRPRELIPSCVRTNLSRGIMLNSVGLSNPGLFLLLKTLKWQKRTKPFWISLMCVAKTPDARLRELITMVSMLETAKKNFAAPFGLQINLSCPNTEHKPEELIAESTLMLDVASRLGVPLMPKYSIASAPIAAIRQLENHPHCDAICVSNTIPFKSTAFDCPEIWGAEKSPLEKLGGGGLSGGFLRPLVCDWIGELREAGFTKPINGGGGIMMPDDVDSYQEAGASSVFIGSVASLRPWRVKSIIARANSLKWS